MSLASCHIDEIFPPKPPSHTIGIVFENCNIWNFFKKHGPNFKSCYTCKAVIIGLWTVGFCSEFDVKRNRSVFLPYQYSNSSYDKERGQIQFIIVLSSSCQYRVSLGHQVNRSNIKRVFNKGISFSFPAIFFLDYKANEAV